MLENVPGLADDARMVSLVQVLTDLGYLGTFKVLDAADFGVPQRRHRVVLLMGRGMTIDFPTAASVRRTVHDAIAKLPKAGTSGDPSHDISEHRTARVRSIISRVPKDGGSMRDLGKEALLACHQRCDGFYDVYGRMRWHDVSPTITSGFVNPSKGRFLHPTLDRCITVREAALLQGFPKNYYFALRRGKYPAAEMIGNAFPPPFAKAVAEMVVTAFHRSTQ
jgi:DNA (cytosine-5)-methyltransferase 1